MITEPRNDYFGWAVVETVNGRLLAGYTLGAVLCGMPCLRVEVPDLAENAVTDQPLFAQYVMVEQIATLTPCTQADARRTAGQATYRPPYLEASV